MIQETLYFRIFLKVYKKEVSVAKFFGLFPHYLLKKTNKQTNLSHTYKGYLKTKYGEELKTIAQC